MATAVPNSTRETLREFANSAGQRLAIDGAERNIIKGVKLLGFQSRNGRSYLPEAVKNAAKLYEGARSNVNHGGKNESRSYGDRLGVIKNVRFKEGEGLFGDLVFNPKHQLAEQLRWDAENEPQSVGFSHVAEGKTRRDGGQTIVEEILSVSSVDLVADPATTNGLFEGEGMDGETPGMPPAGTADEGIKTAFRQAVVAAFDDDSLDTKGTLAKIKDVLKAYEKLKGGGDKPEETKPEGDDMPAEESAKLSDTIRTLREEVDGFKAREALAAKRAKIVKELAEAKLPEEAVTDVFVESLMHADDAGRKALIDDRKTIARTSRPVSRGQESFRESATETKSPTNVKEFMALGR